MANDHLSTPNSIRKAFDQPPNFYEPLTVLAYCAARTERVKLMTGAVVLPIRDPVLLAKQVTTLDHCCDGRLIVGHLGIAIEKPASDVVDQGAFGLASEFDELGERNRVGEPDDAVIARVHSKDEAGPPSDRVLVVARAGPVRRSHFDELRAGGRHDLRQAELAPDLDELAA